ncbi:Uncharacterized protein EJ110_NYTH38413 [Nymphaea thermarum]|nr:Uncharacterized protein EJ110_NYTH38413 [Nymphaea thermarum]
MRGVKGRFLKRLKTMRPLVIRQDRVLQVKAEDAFDLSTDSAHAAKNLLVYEGEGERIQKVSSCCAAVSEAETAPEIIDISELMRDLEEEEEVEDGENLMAFDSSDDKENIRPAPTRQWLFGEKEFNGSNMVNLENCPAPATQNGRLDRKLGEGPLSELNAFPPVRRTRPGSGSLFDPDLLAAFEKAVMNHILSHEAEKEASAKTEAAEQDHRRDAKDPWSEFEERCPPGGQDSVVLYTTTLRAIRKTFEECSAVRHVLSSLRILLDERDVSMHTPFKEELKSLMRTTAAVVPPRLFIKGRFIGGAQEVLGLHEQGKLVGLLRGMAVISRPARICDGCAGVRFVLCFECSGSCKLASLETPDMKKRRYGTGYLVSSLLVI